MKRLQNDQKSAIDIADLNKLWDKEKEENEDTCLIFL